MAATHHLPRLQHARTIAFQGAAGANSDMACQRCYPQLRTLPCTSFEDAFEAVHQGQADLAMIPIENSVAGRVADIHHLLPAGGLHIIGEYFLRVHHHLLAKPGVLLAEIRHVHSHVQALGQCRGFLRRNGMSPHIHADTAGAAEDLSNGLIPPDHAVIASSLAGEIYGLDCLAAKIEDEQHNTTRFVILSPEAVIAPPDAEHVVTSLLFQVRNIPAALYKALGGFATNGVNLSKLESYLEEGRFSAAQFYADVEGHPQNRDLRLALEELGFFARRVQILGTYEASPFRREEGQLPEEE